MALSWKPRRDGDVYCAPACGFKCKWAAYEEAVVNASQLAAELGEGWEPRVWENIGWHYEAKTQDGLVNISWYGDHYTVYVSTEPSSGGQWVASGATTAIALDTARERVAESLAGVQRALVALDA